jgi:hypothetical protein
MGTGECSTGSAGGLTQIITICVIGAGSDEVGEAVHKADIA